MQALLLLNSSKEKEDDEDDYALLFACIFQITAAAALADSLIPSAASIELPPIQVIADYRVHKPGTLPVDHHEMELGDDLQLLEGNYLYAIAEVGMLEHSLTTDLLNHLVFVQKVFMKVTAATLLLSVGN